MPVHKSEGPPPPLADKTGTTAIHHLAFLGSQMGLGLTENAFVVTTCTVHRWGKEYPLNPLSSAEDPGLGSELRW